MPVKKVGKKWRMGKGKAKYDTKTDAESAYRGYLYHKYHTVEGKRG